MAEGEPGAGPIPVRVFISYRREDTRGYAGRLYDSLLQRLPPGQVFMDIDDIEPGVDFVDVLTETVERADVELVLIGPQWVHIRNAKGERRLDDPNDYVRLETEAALRRGIRVIPILLGGALMPQPDELPESLAPLARRNALEVSDGRWRFDVGRLLDTLESVARSQPPTPAHAKVVDEERQADPLEAHQPQQAEEPRPLTEEQHTPSRPSPPRESGVPQAAPAGDGGRRRLILIGGGVLGGSAAAAVVVAIAMSGGGPQPSPTPDGSGGPSISAGIGTPNPNRLSVKIAIDMRARPAGGTLVHAVELAVRLREPELQAAGYDVAVEAFDYENDAVAAANARAIVADPSFVAMIGAGQTGTAFDVIPITNQAGLAECGPIAPGAGLTDQDAREVDLRTHPEEKPSYFRPIAGDDFEGSALATYARSRLEARTAFAVEQEGGGVARFTTEAFTQTFVEREGTVIGSAMVAPTTDDFEGLLDAIDDANPDIVFVGGGDEAMIGRFRTAMYARWGDVAPLLLTGSAIFNGSGIDAGSFLDVTDVAGAGTIAAVTGDLNPPGMTAFGDALSSEFGDEPSWEAAMSYACGEVIVGALLKTSPSEPDLREALRARIFEPAETFDTVLGEIGFDADGDTTRKVIQIMEVDSALVDGAGDWTIVEEVLNPPKQSLSAG